ncbi:MAG: hypothetical protein J0M12_11365 [Deltaproteobacteria bacterium]|nr:hypothetical protein [Deltaproteobacteria bacterium]
MNTLLAEPNAPAAKELSQPPTADFQLSEHCVCRLAAPSVLYAKNVSIHIQAPKDDQVSRDGIVTLQIHDEKTNPVGVIRFEGLSDIGVSELLEPLFEAEMHLQDDLFPAQVISEILARADLIECSRSSSFGEESAEILRAYADAISPGPLRKPHYRFFDLLDGAVIRPNDNEYASIHSRKSGALRWIDITDPKRELLESIAKDLDLSKGTVNLCLDQEQPITANGLKETLFISTKELRFDAQSGVLKLTPLTLIVGKDFVVSMHQGESPAVERVWNEIKREEVVRSDLKSSNYLACRLFGSTVYSAKLAIELLARQSEALNGYHWEPSSDELKRAENLSNSARQAESVMLHLGEIVEALREKRHLFGVGTPKESLSRYGAIIRSSADQSHMIEERVADKRQSWGIEAQNVTNRYTSRLSIAIAALSVPAAIFGFFGQSYANIPFTNTQIWAGNVIAAAASCALLAGLWYFTRKHHEHERKAVN